MAVNDNDKDRAEYVNAIIQTHKNSKLYEIAKVADDYDRCENTTIMNYQKKITLLSGEQVDDRFSATHRAACNFFNIFTTQLNQYLLGNGAGLDEATYDKLGDDFDAKLQKLGKYALCAGVSFGFFNLDHIDAFSALEFAPLYDEETGGLAAGVRFWQLDTNKPLRATLYELDGYTEYMWTTRENIGEPWTAIDKGVYKQDKRQYKYETATTAAEGTEIIGGSNYPGFPIVPLYANPHHQSEIVGLREKIDAYDFVSSGFCDDLDNAQLFWIIQGAQGMDNPDLMQFLERLKTVKMAAPGDGQSVTPVTVDIPYAARETLLNRLETQLYKDAMILNPDFIAGGAVTATQIMAAYERQNVKADMYEYQVLDFCSALFKIAEIDDEPTFTRSVIVNKQDEINAVLSAAQYLDAEYVTTKVLTLLGDGDKAEEMLQKMAADAIPQMNIAPVEENAEDETAEAGEEE